MARSRFIRNSLPKLMDQLRMIAPAVGREIA